jgi:hypothetical protein
LTFIRQANLTFIRRPKQSSGRRWGGVSELL